jgi:hypothetical protein
LDSRIKEDLRGNESTSNQVIQLYAAENHRQNFLWIKEKLLTLAQRYANLIQNKKARRAIYQRAGGVELFPPARQSKGAAAWFPTLSGRRTFCLASESRRGNSKGGPAGEP